VFCEPLAMSNAIRMSLLHYLFLRIKVSRWQETYLSLLSSEYDGTPM
jgi:hypothetical protein